MLANFLEKSKPINFIVYLSAFFGFFLIALITVFFYDNFSWIKVLEAVGFFCLFLAIFFFYNFIVSKNKLTFDHSYAFFVFTLTSIVYVSVILDFKILITLLIYLLYLRKTYSLRSSKKLIQKLFDGGFWLGVLCILEPYSLVFFLVSLSAILLFGRFSIQNLIIPIVGFITPLFIYFTYLFWFDITDNFLTLFTEGFLNNTVKFSTNTLNWGTIVLLLFTFVAVILKSPKAFSINNSFKKSWQLLITHVLVSILFITLLNTENGYEILFLTVPATVIIANGFEAIQKKKIQNILFSILIITTILGFICL